MNKTNFKYSEVICTIKVRTNDKKETSKLLMGFLQQSELRGMNLKQTVSNEDRLRVDIIVNEQLSSWYTAD
jgi:hypothetical protein